MQGYETSPNFFNPSVYLEKFGYTDIDYDTEIQEVRVREHLKIATQTEVELEE